MLHLFANGIDRLLEASVYGSFTKFGPQIRSTLYGWKPTDDLSPLDPDGQVRTILVTGANSGLGLAASKILARAGVRLKILVRSEEKAEKTAAELRRVAPKVEVGHIIADLTEFDTVREAAKTLLDADEPLHGVLHNAGAMFDERRETDAGLERTYALHVVGPHLLTSLLLDRLRQTPDARVVTMTSGGMYTQGLDLERLESPNDYAPATAYARAKRAQVVMNRLWSYRINPREVSFFTTHPGWAATPGVTESLPKFAEILGSTLRTAEQGADTAAWLLLSSAVTGMSGSLWLDRRQRSEHRIPTTRGVDAATENKLWERVTADAGVNDLVPMGAAG